MYLQEKDALHAGGKPRPDDDALTVKELAKAFPESQANAARRCRNLAQNRLEAAELRRILGAAGTPLRVQTRRQGRLEGHFSYQWCTCGDSNRRT
jgi:hypothetical protein